MNSRKQGGGFLVANVAVRSPLNREVTMIRGRASHTEPSLLIRVEGIEVNTSP